MSKDLHESNLTISGAVILGAVIIAWAIVWAAGPRAATNGAIAPTTAPTQAAGRPAGDLSKLTTAGEPYIGSASAPVTIAYWFDYQCPFCRQNEEQTMPSLIKDYVDTGKVRVIFKDFAFLGPDSDKLAIAARAVWDVAPGKFYAWHKAMFDAQGRENSGWATDQKIADVTASVLGQADADRVAALEKSNAAKYKAEIDADRAEGSTYGVSGTPAMVIGKGSSSQLLVGAEPYASVKSAIDSALAKS